MKTQAQQAGVAYGDNIICDTKFDGGAIKIGDREVLCEERLKEELGIVCRPVVDTFRDMTRDLYTNKVEAEIV